MKTRRGKGFTLVELIVVATIVSVLSALTLVSYRIYVRKAVVSVLKNAVMVNVSLIQAHYDINGYWVTDDPDNPNLTTPEELEAAGLVSRNFSHEFIMRVFKRDGYPHVIAREDIGKKKYRVIVSYHFKDRKLTVRDDK